jgi:predicted regulator of Ras-like GTPase activity (Roadblock/LC7/MglB family)
MDKKESDNFDLNKRLQLKKVVSELRDGEDVEGAFLVGERHRVIACELKDNNSDYDIRKILNLINNTSSTSKLPMNDSIFTCTDFDYNGSRILGKKLDDKLTLFVMLKKRSYVSLAMLNFENTIRKIDNILDGFIPKSTHT